MLRTSSRFALIGAALAGVIAGSLSGGPVRAAIDAVMSCSASTACLQWTNTSTGNAIKGISNQGNAVLGKTEFKSTGQPAGKAGVLGQDASTAGNLDFGVQGTSTNGTGVYGLSSSSTGAAGVSGVNNATAHNANSEGVYANGGSFNDGIHSFAGSGNALYAFSQTGTSILANRGQSDTAPELYLQDTTNTQNDIIQAVGPTGDVFDVMSSGSASQDGTVLAQSELEVFPPKGGVAGQFGATSGSSTEAMDLFGGNVGSGDDVLEIYDNDGDLESRITDTGDIWTTGVIHTGGSCGAGCVQNGKRVRMVAEYAPSETEPTIEDNGEAQLVGGRAYVALDPKFANVIDTASRYLVTLTPEGDCSGLYVTNRTPSGFLVRELHGGTSNVGFSYRIVARKFGVHAQRLPMIDLRRASVPKRAAAHTGSL